MVIKPLVRFNVFLTAHPLGLKEFVKEQIDYVKKQNKLTNPPKVVLVVGSSSGYGLASRIGLAFGGNALTIGVSTGGAPKGKRTGKAGFWNTHWFNYFARQDNLKYKNFVGDAFSYELKDEIIDYLKANNLKVDLVVYSLASGVRINPDTKVKVNSALKPIGKNIDTFTVDVASLEKKPLKVEAASEEEIDNTIYTMGGDDWKMWIDRLQKGQVLNQGFKTVAYTYIGGDVTKDIYREGTIGAAKKDLEKTTAKLDKSLQPLGGKSYVSVSKAIVSKASVFIPYMIVYGSCLFDEMMNNNSHESVIAHKYRLFYDLLYGTNLNSNVDEKGRIRLDKFEMDSSIQQKTIAKMDLFNNDYASFLKMKGFKTFVNNFYKINGFNYSNINYEEDIDIEKLLKSTS